MSFACIYILILLLFISLSLSTSHDLPTSSTENTFTFRNMTFSDIDAVTDTLLDAFDPGPLWTYLYQNRDRFPNYHRRCLRQEVVTAVTGAVDETHFGHVIVPTSGDSKRRGGEKDGIGIARSFGWWKMMSKGEGEVGIGMVMAPSLLSLKDIVASTSLDLRTSDSEAVKHRSVEQKPVKESQQARISIPAHSQLDISRWQDDQSVIEAINLPPIPCARHIDMNHSRALHLSPQLSAADKQYIKDAPYEHQLYLALGRQWLRGRPSGVGDGTCDGGGRTTFSTRQSKR